MNKGVKRRKRNIRQIKKKISSRLFNKGLKRKWTEGLKERKIKERKQKERNWKKETEFKSLNMNEMMIEGKYQNLKTWRK